LQFLFSRLKPYPIYFLFITKGCHGTTRLLGAGHISKKDGAYFGPPKPETGLTRSLSPRSLRTSLNQSGDPFHYSDKRKETIPSKDDKPIMGMTTSKNFITANAVEAILQGNHHIHYLFFVLK